MRASNIDRGCLQPVGHLLAQSLPVCTAVGCYLAFSLCVGCLPSATTACLKHYFSHRRVFKEEEPANARPAGCFGGLLTGCFPTKNKPRPHKEPRKKLRGLLGRLRRALVRGCLGSVETDSTVGTFWALLALANLALHTLTNRAELEVKPALLTCLLAVLD